MKQAVVIGGGTSGLFLAIELKKMCPTLNVVILERLERVGKKILATGNGRCNFSNKNVSAKKYNNPSFVSPIIRKLNFDALSKKLEEYGLMWTCDEEGRAYPYSDSANTFLDILRINLKNLKINERCNFEVHKITEVNKGDDRKYLIEDTRKQTILADYVILATGGKAAAVLGSNGSGYNLLKPWKIKITDLEPGLVGIKVDPTTIKGLSGLRVRAQVSLWDKKARQKVWQEFGEVLFKDDGVSGIVIMQMASVISRSNIVKESKNYYFELDLMPKYSEDELLSLLIKTKERLSDLENSNLLNGIFAKNLGFSVIKRSKLDLSSYISTLNIRDLIRIASTIKNFSLDYKGMYGFDRAQVTIGGISLSCVNPKTLEFTSIPNMYASGEVLDVDGECGGYNMHFAMASAYTVACAIKEKMENETNK